MKTLGLAINRSACQFGQPDRPNRSKQHARRKIFAVLVAGILTACSALGAGTTTITFDTLRAGTQVGGQYSHWFSDLSFDTKDQPNNPGGTGLATVVAVGPPAYSGRNVLSIFTQTTEFFGPAWVRGVFGGPHAWLKVWVGSHFTPPVTGVTVTLTAFDVAGNIVASASTVLTIQINAGGVGWMPLLVSDATASIMKFTIDGGSNNDIVIDDVSFDSPYPPAFIPIDIQALLGDGSGAQPNGNYGLKFSLFNQQTSNLPSTQVVTDSVSVTAGLMNAPLSFSPDAFWGQQLSLGIGVKGPSDPDFTPINGPLPIAPAPQALYAYWADSVLALDHGQAVTSLNGLTDAVRLQAGLGITLTTSSNNTIVISTTVAAPSGASPSAAPAAASPDSVLAQLTALKSQNERFEKRISQLEQTVASSNAN
jgi:hypothetical protein